MRHAIACLNTQLGILLHNASVFHGEGREEDRDRNIAEADDLRMAVEVLKDEIPLSERTGLDPVNLWEESAKQYSPEMDLYRSIITRIGELYGESVKFCEPSILPEIVETSVNQFRLLASFVGSKATSHTEIVSDAAAEIRSLRTSLEAERQRRIDAERKLEKFRMDYDAKAAEVVELRGRVKLEPKEQQYRMLEVGEVTQEGDEAHTDSGVWTRLTGYHLGQRINERGSYPVGYYRRPISLDTKPENPETPAA